MATTITCVGAQGAERALDLQATLTPARRDAARLDAIRWIKSLRLAPYGDRVMRDRFTYRNDSLWWFTELYLHKMRRLDVAMETVHALETARDAHEPARIRVDSDEAAVHAAARAFGRAHHVPVDVAGTATSRSGPRWPSFLVGLGARLSRWRPSALDSPLPRADVVAFVHTAFWRPGALPDEGAQDSYIGPVLDAVGARRAAMQTVGVGPRRNFRARRWWDPFTGDPAANRPHVTPIERLAPRSALTDAMRLWGDRHTLADAIVGGPGIRAAACWRGCDLWDVLAPELEAAALVQWPWSARAMDEAAAALDALTPRVVVTYAEAGGWGRALMLEARRRRIPSVGLQHGFIYRHWLNYLHEADEMQVSRGGGAPFPRPDRTLLFDRYAESHLRHAGHFPADSLAVTGSARLDALDARIDELRASGPSRTAKEIAVDRGESIVVLAAKFSEVHTELAQLFDAVSAVPSIRLVVKPHPAETPDVYSPLIARHRNISIAPAETDLARLLAAADAVVTKNSTVAIDGLVLGVPALVIGLPNNLSPFVEAEVMVGAPAEGAGEALRTLLYDREARAALLRRAGAFADAHGMRADGQAAARTADEILRLIG